MRITECNIESFGKLSKCKFDFTSGLNVFKADNGYGKSTLAAFICAMLYGLDDTKKQNLDDNDRKKYMPWAGGIYGGSLSFECSRGLYRIERVFGKKASEDSFILYNAKTGRSSLDFSSLLGEELFGIDKDGFLRTVFLSEKTLSEKNENKTVSAKLSGITGVTADMAELDNALSILDGQRKIYSKKGGGGIISDTQEKLSRLDEQIMRLKQKELGISEAEAELLRIENELRAAREQKESYEKAWAALEHNRYMRTYKEQYEAMRRELSAREEKYRKLEEFFSSLTPTYEEIEEARKKQLEFELSEKAQSAVPDGGELAELRRFFENGVTEEETDRILGLALELECNDEPSGEPSELFALKVPTEEELDEQTKRLAKARLAKSKRGFALLPLILGIGLGITAFLPILASALVLPCIFGGCGLLISALIIFFASNVKKKRETAERKAENFIFSVSGRKISSDPLDTLENMKAMLEEYKKHSLAEDRLRENELSLREIYDYLAKFPTPKSKTLVGAIKEIKEKHRRLDALRLMSEKWAENLSEKMRESMRAMQEAAHFLSRFKTVTERPFDEIRDALTEFNSLKAELDTRRRELLSFAQSHGIDNMQKTEEVPSEAGIAFGKKSAEDKIAALSKEKILLERRIESDRLDTERLDSLISQKNALLQNEQKYAKNLDIIQKTKNYLTEAHRIMTMRYLDKTKAAFDAYMRKIGKNDGDFALDTDFTLTKYEGAAARKTESYSKGTRELYALCLRLALVDSMFEGESPFIILDDPFMSFDDATLGRAKSALAEISKSRQIIYFTCSGARAV